MITATARELVDEQVWREAVAKLRVFVARRVPAEDIDDVVQNIFVKIQSNLGSLRDEQRFGPWVYQIARRVVSDHMRAKDRARELTTDFEGTEPESELADDSFEASRRELGSYTASLVERLPADYRDAIRLVELEGLRQSEAAELMGLSLSGMKSRVQRGRQKLRDELERCCRVFVDARKRALDCEPRAGDCDCG